MGSYKLITAETMISSTLIDWLQEQGFDPTNINSRIGNGMSALMQASLLAETSFVRELLDSGIDVNMLNDDENNALWFGCFSESLEIIALLIARDINVDNINQNGATSLIYAASAGKFDVVKALVEAGAHLRHRTLDGFDALESASTVEVLRFLKQRYAA